MGGADTGFLILEHVCAPRPTAEVVVRHHERPDGSGYPRGLTDREICQAARAGPGRAGPGRAGPGRAVADVVAACVTVFVDGFTF